MLTLSSDQEGFFFHSVIDHVFDIWDCNAGFRHVRGNYNLLKTFRGKSQRKSLVFNATVSVEWGEGYKTPSQ